MEITHQNWLHELNVCNYELELVSAALKKIKVVSPKSDELIKQLNDRYAGAIQHLPKINKFIAVMKPNPKILNGKLKKANELCRVVERENKRLLKGKL
jgi:hypothetical protein